MRSVGSVSGLFSTGSLRVPANISKRVALIGTRMKNWSTSEGQKKQKMGLHVYHLPTICLYTLSKLPHKPQMFSAHQVKQNKSEVETLSSLLPNDVARSINIAPPRRKNDSAPHADLNQLWIWASIWASWGAKEYEGIIDHLHFLNMGMLCSLQKRCR